METRRVLEVPIEKIIPNPYQPRKEFFNESLKELSASIKSYGILQPLSVRKIGKDRYELVAGERRLKAAKMANMATVPVILQEQLNDKDSAVLAIIENLQREDLSFIEEAKGYLHLIEDHGFTQKQLSKKIGKNQSTIANKMRLLRLDEDILKKLAAHGLTERHGRALLKLPDDELRVMTLDQVIAQDFNVKRTEELVKEILMEIQQEVKLEEEVFEESHIDEHQESILGSKENEGKNQKVKGYMNYKIYLNTIQEAYKAIQLRQEDAEFFQEDMGDYIRIVMKIPKV